MKKNYFLAAILSFAMISMNAQFNDDMESYTDGAPISGDWWTDWGCGGGAGCAIMSSSEHAHSGSLSGYIPNDESTDAVLDFGNQTFGEWGTSFWFYVPSDADAYFNYQGTVPIGSGEWMFNCFFNDELSPGAGLYTENAGSDVEDVPFTHPVDEWFQVIANFDISLGMDAATYELMIAGEEVIAAGTALTSAGATTTSLGGVDFWSNSGDNHYWVDDVVLQDSFITLGSADFESTGFRSALSNNILTLKANEEISNVSIYNMLGQEVYTSSVNTSSINMASFANGTYIVRVNINGTEGTVKIVK